MIMLQDILMKIHIMLSIVFGEEADKYGIYDKTAVLAMFETESSWRTQPAGDGLGYGLGQLSYEYWSDYDLNSQR